MHFEVTRRISKLRRQPNYNPFPYIAPTNNKLSLIEGRQCFLFWRSFYRSHSFNFFSFTSGRVLHLFKRDKHTSLSIFTLQRCCDFFFTSLDDHRSVEMCGGECKQKEKNVCGLILCEKEFLKSFKWCHVVTYWFADWLIDKRIINGMGEP